MAAFGANGIKFPEARPIQWKYSPGSLVFAKMWFMEDTTGAVCAVAELFTGIYFSIHTCSRTANFVIL